MNAATLQRWIDEVLETSRQQWLLRAVAFVSPIGAVLAATGATGRSWATGLVLVSLLAGAAAIRPDTHISLVGIALIMWHWLATVDRIDTWWLPLAVICLVVHHTVAALTATIPTGGEVPGRVLRCWSGRLLACSALTVVVWVATVGMDRRNAPGNGLLTALALGVVASTALLIRSRSVEHSPTR